MVPENHSLDILKEKALATGGEVPGLEAFPDSQVQIPRLLIGQPSNISGMPAGVFVDSLTKQNYNELDVVLIKMSRSRALWRPGNPQPGEQPLCRAQNAMHADQDFYNRRCGLCISEDTNTHEECIDEHDRAVCEHAKFKKDKRPECRLAYHLLIVLVQTADPYILSVTGKSISPTNKLLSAFKVRGRPPYSARFKISLKKATDGNYYTVEYSDMHWLESVDELKNLFARFRDINLTPTQPEAEPGGINHGEQEFSES